MQNEDQNEGLPSPDLGAGGNTTAEDIVKVEKRSRELAPLIARQNVLAIMPTTIEEAQRYANGLCLSGIVPDAFREGGRRDGLPNAPLVMMGILKSMELGVPPQTGLSGLLPLNGRFAVWGDLAAALVHRTGEVAKQQVVEIGAANLNPDSHPSEWPDAYGIRVLYWRTGQEDPYVGEFTVRDAKRGGLWNNARKQPWVQYPKRMLFNRARAFALRDGFADGLAGLTIADEVVDYMPDPPTERGSSPRLASLIDDAQEEADASVQTDA